MIEYDPGTLRALARELDRIADQTGGVTDTASAHLCGFVNGLAATYRTRAIQAEQARNEDTREIPASSRHRGRRLPPMPLLPDVDDFTNVRPDAWGSSDAGREFGDGP
jgi:hypothetical protein